MAACSLAVITSSFAPGQQLHRAIGTWAAMNGLGGAAGMLFGGSSRRSSPGAGSADQPPDRVAPPGRVCGRERAPPRAGPSFDLAGALTLTIGQMVLVYGVVEAGLGLGTFAALGPISASCCWWRCSA